jgi:hypothetical protein
MAGFYARFLTKLVARRIASMGSEHDVPLCRFPENYAQDRWSCTSHWGESGSVSIALTEIVYQYETDIAD